MTTAFRKKFADAKSLNFANPGQLDHTLRIVLDNGTKSVKGVSALNNRLDVISGSTGTLVEGDRSVGEPLSVRVSLSGSITNAALIEKRWTEIKAVVDAAIADKALTGFLPVNAVFNIVE